MVERLVAGARGLDEDRELLLDALLADEVLEPLRPQRALEVVLGGKRPRVVHRAVLHLVHAGRPDPPAHRAALSAPAISSSGVAPPDWSSSRSASCGVKPSPSRPSRASVRGSSEAVRRTTMSSVALPATLSRSSTMMRSAVRLPMPGTAWKRAVSPAARALISSRGVPPLSTASATLGP